MISAINPEPMSSSVEGEGKGVLDFKRSAGAASGIAACSEARGLFAIMVTANRIKRKDKTATFFIFSLYRLNSKNPESYLDTILNDQ
jgi:hypothetical protein